MTLHDSVIVSGVRVRVRVPLSDSDICRRNSLTQRLNDSFPENSTPYFALYLKTSAHLRYYFNFLILCLAATFLLWKHNSCSIDNTPSGHSPLAMPFNNYGSNAKTEIGGYNDVVGEQNNFTTINNYNSGRNNVLARRAVLNSFY